MFLGKWTPELGKTPKPFYRVYINFILHRVPMDRAVKADAGGALFTFTLIELRGGFGFYFFLKKTRIGGRGTHSRAPSPQRQAVFDTQRRLGS